MKKTRIVTTFKRILTRDEQHTIETVILHAFNQPEDILGIKIEHVEHISTYGKDP